MWKLITTQHENRLYYLGCRYHSLQREAFLNPGTSKRRTRRDNACSMMRVTRANPQRHYYSFSCSHVLQSCIKISVDGGGRFLLQPEDNAEKFIDKTGREDTSAVCSFGIKLQSARAVR